MQDGTLLLRRAACARTGTHADQRVGAGSLRRSTLRQAVLLAALCPAQRSGSFAALWASPAGLGLAQRAPIYA